MNSRDDNNPNASERLDQATSHRLAKLRAMPVDLSSLDRKLRASLPARLTARLGWLRPMRIAAALLLASGIVVAVLVATHETSAIASPIELVRLHEHAVSGRGPHVMTVQSIDEASRALAAQWSNKPELPEMPGAEVMACCLHEMGHTRMVAVTMQVDEGAPITMAVADAGDMRSPRGPTVQRNGVTWHVQSAEGINMVSTRRAGRWVCLMGRLPVDRLMDMAESLKF